VRRYLLEGKPKPSLRRPNNGNGREPNPDAEFVETTWDQALGLIAHKWADTKAQYGGDAFAAFTSAKCTNEENYLMQKLTRQVMGTHNVDHCARL